MMAGRSQIKKIAAKYLRQINNTVERVLNVVHHCLIYLKQIVKQRSGRGQLVYAHGIHSGFVVRFGCS